MIRNPYFSQFEASLRDYLYTHRWFLARRQHLIVTIKNRFEILQQKYHTKELDAICHLLIDFEMYAKEMWEKKVVRDKAWKKSNRKVSIKEGILLVLEILLEIIT